jgi:hypothetical protein
VNIFIEVAAYDFIRLAVPTAWRINVNIGIHRVDLKPTGEQIF